MPVCIRDVSSAGTSSRGCLRRQTQMKNNKERGRKPASRRKQVLLVDRHPLMRDIVARWVNRCDGLEVCGATGDVTRALQAVRQLRPDVVVSEIMRPYDFGFIRELHRRHPRVPILVFTIQDETVYAVHALEAGARGYLMKEAGGEKLIRCIRRLLRRHRPQPAAGQDSAWLSRRLQPFAEAVRQPPETDSAPGRLSGGKGRTRMPLL